MIKTSYIGISRLAFCLLCSDFECLDLCYIRMSGVIVINSENGIDKLSSISTWGCLYLLDANALWKSINLFLPPAKDKIARLILFTQPLHSGRI